MMPSGVKVCYQDVNLDLTIYVEVEVPGSDIVIIPIVSIVAL
jgi:hypothetical protein